MLDSRLRADDSSGTGAPIDESGVPKGGSIGSSNLVTGLLAESEARWEPLPYVELTESMDKAIQAARD